MRRVNVVIKKCFRFNVSSKMNKNENECVLKSFCVM